MKIVYCRSAVGDNHKLFENAYQHFRQLAEQFGLQVIYLDLNDRACIRDLIRLDLSDQDILYSNIWLYDLKINSFGLNNAIYETYNLIDELVCSKVATIADHPFMTFMYARVERASNRFNYQMLDLSFAKESELLFGRTLKGFPQRGIFTPSVNENELPEYASRPIDVFAPMNLNQPKDRALWKDLGDSRFLNFLLDIWNNYDYLGEESPLIYLARVYEDINGYKFSFPDLSNELKAVLIDFLSELDNYARFKHRYQVINMLALNYKNIEIYLTQSPIEGLEKFSNLKWLGPVDNDQCINLMANSRTILHCHPTYFDGLHERPILAQSLGCQLLTPNLRWTNLLLKDSYKVIDFNESSSEIMEFLSNKHRGKYVLQPTPIEISNHCGSLRFMTDLLTESSHMS